MSSLFRFIQRFHFIILFVLLETFTFMLAVNSNKKKKAIVVNSANVISGTIYEQVNSYREYFNLKKENQLLMEDNIHLRNQLLSSYLHDTSLFHLIHDTFYIQQYSYIDAKVIKNSIFLQKNFITIDKGKRQGIDEDIAVINPEGVVGIIIKSSENFSIAASLLNTNLGISAKIKKNGYYGSIIWDGSDYKKAILKDIPNHVAIETGDTIVTSGYSAIFPEGILIGTISEFEKNSKDNFFTIKVNLSVDFKNVENVYLIKNLLRKEQLLLEEQTLEMIE